MHIPDGFIDAQTSAAAGLVAAAGIGLALRRSADLLDDRRIPLAGVTSAFIFAVQMVNFPVAGGTSGHLLGGLLAAVLVGPWLGALCLSVVVVVQALLFADGGLTAIGLNVVNMAFITALGGYTVFLVVRRFLPREPASLAFGAGIAAGVSVVLAAAAFVLEYAAGGQGGAGIVTVATATIGVHVLIGIGEGIITALTVGAVLAARPDLVHGAHHVSSPPFPAEVDGVAA